MAYIISGHGTSPKRDTFVVPEGCVIIASAKQGEELYGSRDYKFTELPLEVLRDPLNHRAALIETFGTLAFYTAGDICPNFQYSLFPFFRGAGGLLQERRVIGGGIISVDKLQRIALSSSPDSLDQLGTMKYEKPFKGGSLIEWVGKIQQFYGKCFMTSEFPTSLNVKQMIADFFNESDPMLDMNMSLLASATTFSDQLELINSWLVGRYPDIFETSQSFLCNTLRMRGVFFNFVCRPEDSTNAARLYNRPSSHNTQEERKGHMIRKNTSLFETADPNLRLTMLKQIAEAEMHRKSAIRDWSNAKYRGGYRFRRNSNQNPSGYTFRGGHRSSQRNKRKTQKNSKGKRKD